MDSSFYDTYNKKDDQGCLIGNWVEERALQDTTGTFRHKFDDPNPRFVRSQMRPDEEDTHARTIFHTNREEAGALETANQNRYADPKVIGQDAGKGLAYKAELKGARAKMMEKGFLEAAKQVEEEEVEGAGVTLSEERFLESTTGTAFRGAVADPEEVGRRIMKTQDMEPIPAESVDVTFLRENNLRDPRRTMVSVIGEEGRGFLCVV
mmetsp:Transcript_26845/g.69016  ORF Transcript_26845/g.69016 Transcript_26845/m.69016 type:complete len:208 (-) Transcript_26845:473-1096(-)